MLAPASSCSTRTAVQPNRVVTEGIWISRSRSTASVQYWGSRSLRWK